MSNRGRSLEKRLLLWYIIRLNFSLFLRIERLKAEKTFLNSLICTVSAVLIAAGGALCLFASAESEIDDDSVVISQFSINADDSTFSFLQQNFCGVRSSVKCASNLLPRRPEPNLPAPFILLPLSGDFCGAPCSAHHTPVPQNNSDPANYVRAGPGCFLSKWC